MTIPVKRKVLAYLGLILINQIIVVSLITLGVERVILSVIAVTGLIGVSVLLVQTAIVFRRKINEQLDIEKKLRESEQELLLAIKSAKESQAGLFAKEI